MQFVLQLIAISSTGVIAGSLEYTTFKWRTLLFFELPPHDARQRTAGRLINIRHLKRGRIHLVARSHAADDRRIALLCLHHQLDFTGHGIDCVHNIVILGKIELIRRIRHVNIL